MLRTGGHVRLRRRHGRRVRASPASTCVDRRRRRHRRRQAPTCWPAPGRPSSTAVYPGDGAGHFGAAAKPTTRFAKARPAHRRRRLERRRQERRGRPQRAPPSGSTSTTATATGGFGATHRLLSLRLGRLRARPSGAGDLNGDGHPDLVARSADNRLWLVAGHRQRGSARADAAPSDWAGFDLTAGLRRRHQRRPPRPGRPRRGRPSRPTSTRATASGGLGIRASARSPRFAGVDLLLSRRAGHRLRRRATSSAGTPTGRLLVVRQQRRDQRQDPGPDGPAPSRRRTCCSTSATGTATATAT